MIHATNSAAQAPASQPNPVSSKAAQPKPQSKSQPTNVDTVKLTSGAKAVLQEALESPAQTAKEASARDAQAKRLIAKEAAARPSTK
jgi:hypothetical protein